MAKAKPGKLTSTANASGILVFTDETALLVQEDEEKRLVYDIGELLEGFEGESITVTVKKEQPLATSSKGVKPRAVQGNVLSPSPKKAE